MEITGHACMLPKQPIYDDLHPTANIWQRLRRRWRHLLLPCEWHHGCQVFFRSRKSLELEQERQLKSGYWFICHAYSPFKFYWDSFVWALTAIIGVYTPWQVFRQCPNPADPFILAADITAFFDIIVVFCSAYNDKDIKEIVLEPKKIAIHYLKGSFIMDVISALPLQLYSPFSDCRFPSHTVFFPFKLLRWHSCKKKWDSLVEQLGMSYSCTVLLMVMIRLFFFFNWMTYWQYQVPALWTHYYDMDNLGVAEAAWLERFHVDTTTSAYIKYITNLYYVAGRSIGAGYCPPVKYYVLPEMVQNCISGTVSLIFLIFIFMTILRLVLCSQSNYIMFDGAERDLEKYMTIKRLPKQLQQKIWLFVNYKFGGSYMDEAAILDTINEQIKHDINMHTCRQLVVTVPMFEDFPISLINTMIFSLKQEVFIPGQAVIKCGRPNSNFYLIYYGTVVVNDENGIEVKHVNDGGFFGEDAILNSEKPAKITVTALEITETYVLNNKDFEECIQPYPEVREELMETYRNT